MSTSRCSIVLSFFLFVVLSVPAWAAPPYVVYTYLQSFRSINISNFPWADMTHIVDAFAEPNTNGTVTPSGRVGLIAQAHARGIKFIVSFGGATTADTTWETAIGSNESTLVQNIMSLVTNGDGTVNGSGQPNSYDGVDIDWEFPHSGDKTMFMNFMLDLANHLHATTGFDGNPRILTMYTTAGSNYSGGKSPLCGVDWSQAATIIDYTMIGAYDDYCTDTNGVQFNGPLSMTSPCGFSPCASGFNNTYADGIHCVSRLVGLGFPQNKIILGIPMYGNGSSTFTDDQVFSGGVSMNYYPGDAESTYSYSSQTIAMDASQSYCEKINWTQAQSPSLAGIGLWEAGYALSSNSEVLNVWNVIGGNSSCLVLPPTNTPTATFTPTVTYTPTNTLTPTPTFTPCFNILGTPCATNTPTPFSYTGVVPVVAPNPSDGTVPPRLLLPLTTTSVVEVKIFTVALRKISDITFPPVAPGAPIPLAFTDGSGNSLSNGLYYLVVTTDQGASYTIKWLVLR